MIADYNEAIAINPQFAEAFFNRGIAKNLLGDKQGAIADYNQAISINPQYATAWGARGSEKYVLGDRSGCCNDMRVSASLGSATAKRLLSQLCQ